MKIDLQSFLHNIFNNILPPLSDHRKQIGLEVRRLCVELSLQVVPHGCEIIIFIIDDHMICSLLPITHQLQYFLSYEEEYIRDRIAVFLSCSMVLLLEGVIEDYFVLCFLGLGCLEVLLRALCVLHLCYENNIIVKYKKEDQKK